MNAAILSGGSGSFWLQKEFYERNNFFADLIINMFDNGTSSGMIRNTFGCFGPSDFRKNHLNKYIIKNIDIKKNDLVVKLYNLRITKTFSNKFSFINYIKKILYKYKFLLFINRIFPANLFDDKLIYFFKKNKVLKDFSFMNIIYGILLTELSIDKINYHINNFLGLNGNIINVFTDSRYNLYGLSSAGKLYDEEKISNFSKYSKRNERLVTLKLNSFNHEIDLFSDDIPDVYINKQVNNYNTFIVSTGTFWSSILPTLLVMKKYIINKKFYVFINSQPDLDTPKYTLSNYIDLYTQSFNAVKFNGILRFFNTKKSYYLYDNFEYIYYNDIFKNKHIIFDYDDTLYFSKNKFYNNDIINNFLMIKNKSIVTGNSLINIDKRILSSEIFYEEGISYNGKNIFKNIFKNILINKFKINCKIDGFTYSGIIVNLIKVNKYMLRCNIEHIIENDEKNKHTLCYSLNKTISSNLGGCFKIRGKTTIEFSSPKLNKSLLIKKIYKKNKTIFIGNEMDGNDKECFAYYTDSICINNPKQMLNILKYIKNIQNG